VKMSLSYSGSQHAEHFYEQQSSAMREI
jgi:hypothetical protein